MRKQEFRFQTNLPSPARRGSRSRPPLRRPRPLRFERLRVPVWNPYSRGRLGPAKSEDRKGGEGKTDANLTNFLSTDAAGWATTPARWSAGESPAPAHRRNFQSMLLGSNKLLATESRNPDNLRRNFKACFLEVTSYWRQRSGNPATLRVWGDRG